MRGISLIIAAALLSAGGASAPSLADGETFKDCQQCPEMIALRGGSFTMGSPESEPERRSNEGPQRRVTIAGFAVGKYEVTFAEWDACVSAGGCSHRPEDRWGRGDQPMMRVSWNDAQEYVRWLSQQTGQTYRLPSEAEWEYAARAGTETPFHTGPRITLEQANFKGNQGYNGSAKGVWPKQTVPVGSFPANGWGLHDVHGNVWEWVQDCWHGDYSGAPTDGSAWMNDSNGDCSMAVLRGGSWSFDPWYLRSAVRLGVPRDVRNYIFGFRVARTLKCLADVATECVRPSSAAEPPAPPPPAFPREADYRAAQTELRRLRLYSSGIDGDWGPGSRRAMTAFQRQAGIAPADGALTELSLAALRLAPTPPEPERQPEPVAQPPAPQPASAPSRTPGERFQDCDACPEMVVIPAGSFTMGSPENEPGRHSYEGPQRRVTVPSFALGRTEVTFQQWDACVSAGGCSHRPDDEGWGRGSRPSDHRFLGRRSRIRDMAQQPDGWRALSSAVRGGVGICGTGRHAKRLSLGNG